MRPKWTFAVVSTALFMVVLDNLVVTTALPSIRADLGATIESLQWTVNAYTLAFAVLLLTGAALGDRFGRKRMFSIGVSALHGRLRGCRARAHDVRADRRPRGPGRGGRHGAAAHADPALRGVPRRPPRARARPVVGHLRPRRRDRPAGRRRRRRRHLVALDLLDQRPDRHRARPAGRALPDRELRPGARAGPPRPRARRPRPAGHRLRDRARQRARLDEHRDRRLARRRRRARGRVHRLGAARPAPDAADALLPLPHVRRGQRRRLRDVLRRVRLDLPAGAVPAGHAGPLAARGGHPDPAVDGDADADRADRRASSPTGSARGR